MLSCLLVLQSVSRNSYKARSLLSTHRLYAYECIPGARKLQDLAKVMDGGEEWLKWGSNGSLASKFICGQCLQAMVDLSRQCVHRLANRIPLSLVNFLVAPGSVEGVTEGEGLRVMMGRIEWGESLSPWLDKQHQAQKERLFMCCYGHLLLDLLTVFRNRDADRLYGYELSYFHSMTLDLFNEVEHALSSCQTSDSSVDSEIVQELEPYVCHVVCGTQFELILEDEGVGGALSQRMPVLSDPNILELRIHGSQPGVYVAHDCSGHMEQHYVDDIGVTPLCVYSTVLF